MERQDLLIVNAGIFSEQGRALNDTAKPSIKVLVDGNPANTNALIAMTNAPTLPPEAFSAMTRLDHNRALSHLAARCGGSVRDVRKVTIWGNHSTTQFPDLSHATVRGRPAIELVGQEWYEQEFIQTVQRRGATVIEARGKSSAASAANAAIDHMRTWLFGTPPDDWVSMAIPCKGEYGMSEGVVFSFPVTVRDGKWEVVRGLKLDEFSQSRLRLTERELLTEREMIAHLL
jgi:malate dehydrogenase